MNLWEIHFLLSVVKRAIWMCREQWQAKARSYFTLLVLKQAGTFIGTPGWAKKETTSAGQALNCWEIHCASAGGAEDLLSYLIYANGRQYVFALLL